MPTDVQSKRLNVNKMFMVGSCFWQVGRKPETNYYFYLALTVVLSLSFYLFYIIWLLSTISHSRLVLFWYSRLLQIILKPLWSAVMTSPAFSGWKPCFSADHKQFLTDRWSAVISSPVPYSIRPNVENCWNCYEFVPYEINSISYFVSFNLWSS